MSFLKTLDLLGWQNIFIESGFLFPLGLVQYLSTRKPQCSSFRCASPPGGVGFKYVSFYPSLLH